MQPWRRRMSDLHAYHALIDRIGVHSPTNSMINSGLIKSDVLPISGIRAGLHATSSLDLQQPTDSSGDILIALG